MRFISFEPSLCSKGFQTDRVYASLLFLTTPHAGFGELFARNVLGVRLGWPLASSPASASQGSQQRANTGSVGLRAAGASANSNPNIGREVPGHAGAKTATEAVVEGARELAEWNRTTLPMI